MRTARIRGLAALLALTLGATVAEARGRVGLSLGFNFGVPVYYRPCYGPGYYYRPYPVYVAPPPLVVQPVPVVQPVTVVQPAPVVQAVQPVYQAPAPVAAPAPTIARAQRQDEPPLAGIDQCLEQLRSQDERARSDAAIQLGRLKARRAVGPLTQALQTERNPAVRDAAARGLGLIGDPVALNALQRAAQADDDRDVRHSAAFAAEILRSNLRNQ